MALETKANLEQETIDQLQELIQLNIDSRDGFRLAADSIDDLTLSTLFQSLAVQRDSQANDLASFVEWNHQQPTRSGSYLAALHRSWMSVREALTSNNTYAMLAEVERGEDQIKQGYEQVLRATPGSAVNDVLLQHYAQVKAAHDRIRDLRDEHKNA